MKKIFSFTIMVILLMSCDNNKNKYTDKDITVISSIEASITTYGIGYKGLIENSDSTFSICVASKIFKTLSEENKTKIYDCVSKLKIDCFDENGKILPEYESKWSSTWVEGTSKNVEECRTKNNSGLCSSIYITDNVVQLAMNSCMM